jgi:DNA-binding response OmpR family regulator
MQNSKLLVIDDDPALCQLLKAVFSRVGATVVAAHDGHQGVSMVQEERPDLVILDIRMPHLNGWETCRQIRGISNVPVIMLTALHSDGDIIRGLEAGADDFLSKPFSPSILIARAQAALRREARIVGEKVRVYQSDRLCIDVEQRRVTVQDKSVKLTAKEFKLLVYLVENAGRLLTFDQILDHVWGWEYGGNMDYVHVYISHLRRKLGDDPRQPRYITTEYGAGYRFDPSIS